MAVMGIAVTFLVNVLQIMYQSKSASPLDAQPGIMLIAISSFLIYCFGFYLKHNMTSMFGSSTCPVILFYTNFMSFLGFVSIASFTSIIFSTSSTTSAVVYLLLALFFSGKSVLSSIQNRNSFAMRRSNSYSILQVHVDLPRIQAFDVHTLPV
ncbi:hypothetical protein POM88_037513 [Heracleum sosnowskyi]|uniref:Uncharacterized protein n=1 Tax=Heracleum sosnowskyi TaxID=360622 RepID=A0AAD8HQL8_9APIA|nr:hypothetical protein POM88_037513 [Heracleum sosnowskyi]